MRFNLALRAAAFGLLVVFSGAQAVVQPDRFSGTLASGYYAGESFSGSFSFDDAARVPVGAWLDVDSLSMLLLGNAYTLADAAAPSGPGYVDGSLPGLSYSVSSGETPFGLVPGVPGVGPAYLAYDSVLGDSGSATWSIPAARAQGLDDDLAGLGLVGVMVDRARRRAV